MVPQQEPSSLRCDCTQTDAIEVVWAGSDEPTSYDRRNESVNGEPIRMPVKDETLLVCLESRRVSHLPNRAFASPSNGLLPKIAETPQKEDELSYPACLPLFLVSQTFIFDEAQRMADFF